MDVASKGEVDDLLRVLAGLRGTDEMHALLQDLFTPQELRDISQRLSLARMLDQGQSYTDIEAATGASATTIARVSRCLGRGAGGYRLALDILRNKEV